MAMANIPDEIERPADAIRMLRGPV